MGIAQREPLMDKILAALDKEREMIVFEECQKAEAEVKRRIKEKVASIVTTLHRDITFERFEERLVITVRFEEK
jgi:hypothetical protein